MPYRRPSPAPRTIFTASLLGLMLAAPACGRLAPPLPIERSAADESEPIGTAHPFLLRTADTHGRWVVLCQAREDTDGNGEVDVWLGYREPEGDALRPYVVFGSGEGLAIDEFYGSSPDGEHLVVARDGELLVHHVSSGRTDALVGADLEEHGTIWGASRAVQFDAAGRRIVYHVARTDSAQLIVRDLETGDEIDLWAPGVVYQISFSNAGDWLLVDLVTHDTNGDGALSYPRPTRPRPRACWTTRSVCITEAAAGPMDAFTFHVAPSTGGLLRPLPGFVREAGPLLLARGEGGELIAHATDGSATEWAPAACNGDVLASSAAHQRALMACPTGQEGQKRIMIHGPGVHHPLATGQRIHRTGSSEVARFAAYERDDATFVADLVEGREWPVPATHRVVESFDEGVILKQRRGSFRDRERWYPVTGAFEPEPPPRTEPGYGTLAQTVDGRRLVMLHPPPRKPPPPPLPTKEPPRERDFTSVVDLPATKTPLPRGPLVWRRSAR